MNPDQIIQTIRTADALLSLAATLLKNVGYTVAKVEAMRDQNADGHLTDAQIKQLADDARAAIARL